MDTSTWKHDAPLDKLFHTTKQEVLNGLEQELEVELKKENPYSISEEELKRTFVVHTVSDRKDNLVRQSPNDTEKEVSFKYALKELLDALNNSSKYGKNRITAIVEDGYNTNRQSSELYKWFHKPDNLVSEINRNNQKKEEIVEALAKYLAHDEFISHNAIGDFKDYGLIHLLNEANEKNTDKKKKSNLGSSKSNPDQTSFRIRLLGYLLKGANVEIFSKTENLEEGETLLRPTYGEIASLLEGLSGNISEAKSTKNSYIARRIGKYNDWQDDNALTQYQKIKEILEPFKVFGNFEEVIKEIEQEIEFYKNPEKN